MIFDSQEDHYGMEGCQDELGALQSPVRARCLVCSLEKECGGVTTGLYV